MLENTTIWITGASRGIGLAIAEKLANENAVLILSSSNPHTIKNIIPKFKDNKNVYFFPFDLADADAVVTVYDKIMATIGKIDILINNAGTARLIPFTDTTLEEFDKMINVNLRGCFLTIKSVLPDMLSRKEGMIININSNAAIKTFKKSSVYSASKAGLLAMSKSLREEVRGEGIKIIDIFPGATATEIWSGEVLEKMGDGMIKPEEIAELVYNVIILNAKSGFITEEILVKPQRGDL